MSYPSILAAAAIAAMVATGALADGEATKGQITKIDDDQSKLTIQHEPIKKFEMDAMTMVFKAAEPAMTAGVKVGDKVLFHVDKINGQMTVTKLERLAK